MGSAREAVTHRSLGQRAIRRSPERNWIPVTSNLPFDVWIEVLGRKRLIGALLDRATHPVTSLDTNVDSYRRNACGTEVVCDIETPAEQGEIFPWVDIDPIIKIGESFASPARSEKTNMNP